MQAVGTTDDVGPDLPVPRSVSRCAAAQPHDEEKAVQTGTPHAGKAAPFQVIASFAAALALLVSAQVIRPKLAKQESKQKRLCLTISRL